MTTTTPARIRQLKDAEQDFEWYPTTDEILQTIADDLPTDYHYRPKTLLDVGAGDGRALLHFSDAVKRTHDRSPDLFAIEKATPHISNMPDGITVIGTDFAEQTLVDKPVDVVFCNPPYSEFVEWTDKLIREANCKRLYLVIPRRWRSNARLMTAIETRGAKIESLGEFDFENADRAARAKVEIVRVRYNHASKSAFDTTLDDMLPELDVFTQELPPEKSPDQKAQPLIEAGHNVVESLAMAYDSEIATLLENYRAALRIDRRTLKELGIDRDVITNGIRQKVKGLKAKYWAALFEQLDTVTKRLATKQRKQFLDSLNKKVSVDFTANNAYAILIWVGQNANKFFDEQLCELFRTLSTDSNIERYKSNQRVWKQGDWFYHRTDADNAASHYRLEYRLVVSHGGICTDEYEWQRKKRRGLSERAFDLLRDIVTVANNLGFECDDSPGNYDWASNVKNELKLKNGETLVAVRAFQNGNMHFHFNPSIMLAINVEAGRLLGWVRDWSEAADELKATPAESAAIAELFGSQFCIGNDGGLNIEHHSPEQEHSPEPEQPPEPATDSRFLASFLATA